VLPNIFRIIIVLFLPYAQKRTEQKASVNGEVYRSLQNCGFYVRNMCHGILRATWQRTFVMPRIWEVPRSNTGRGDSISWQSFHGFP